MKLLKIGSSSNCNVVLNSKYVSSLHAEMLLTDDGRIFIEDKNSLNGTFVGNRQLTANEKTQVQRGDLVRFGDAELNWNKVPVYKGPKAGEEWFNIGSGEKCDILVSGPFIGRYHSILMVKDKKAYIMDNDSRNGTLVDGKKIAPNKFVPIKRGTNVICGDTDVTDQIQEYIPKPLAWLKPLLITLGTAAVLVGVFFLAKGLFKPSVDTKAYADAVVYVDACYHYVAVIEDSPIPKTVWDGKLKFNNSNKYSATAFFVDEKGVMATNRHVAIPWEYADEAEKTEMMNLARRYLDAQLGGIERITIPTKRTDPTLSDQIQTLTQNSLGETLYDYWSSTDRSVSTRSMISSLNTMIASLRNVRITLVGELDYITVGYPGRNYTHMDEFDRCFVLGESNSPDKDIALLQLNTKHTPDNIGKGISIERVYEGTIEPLEDKLVWVGYPRGAAHALLENTHSMQPVIRETMVSQKPDRFTFEFQGESLGGASGSPIYNPKTGELYGVLWGRWTAGATFGKACMAKYLKELYAEYEDIL
ncbi:MAG: FHA domain-containing protein [Bacteroidales bacterium]|nr:FHA domain-containing protein [Bacteroidales bacterium]